MTLLLVYFSLAIGVSFLCSILEAVLLSITPSFVASSKNSGERAFLLMETLKKDIEKPLASILSLNTVAHTVGAAGVGAQAQLVFQNIPFSIISGILTLFILLFSEIIPKTLGAQYWRTLAVPCAYLIQWLVYLMWPLVYLSGICSRCFTAGRQNQSTISRDEIRAVVDLGHKEGLLDRSDARMLHSLMAFQSIRIQQLFTPRPVVCSLPADKSLGEIIDYVKSSRYSRYPVIDEKEEVLGYALRDDLLVAASNDQWKIPLSAFTHPILTIPEQTTVKRALGMFLRKRIHIAAVVDEFGSFSGVLTLEDVIETLIGHEIVDESDTVEDLRLFARESMEKRFKFNSGPDTDNE
ncbi:MAG: HlyC/CorC family transporter [Opitutales bacterium]|nr:HlyC/CorC family transporter [Opitutales bacterium]